MSAGRSNISARLLRGSLWISAARLLTNLLSALSTIVLARLLTPEDFGLVALGTSLLVVVQAFTELSLSQALIHTADPTREHYNTAWSINLARGLLLAVAFAAFAPLLADLYDEPRLRFIFYAIGASALMGGLQNPKLVKLQKELSFHQSAMLNVSSTLVNVATSIGLAWTFRSYWALIGGLIAGQLANVVISYAMLPYRPSVGWSRLKELWQFSVWLSLGQVVNTLNYRLDQLLVGTFLGRPDLGLYTVGSRLAILPGQELVRPLTNTLFPAFKLASSDADRLRGAYLRAQTLTTAIALPASIGFGLVADPAVRLVLGPDWVGAIPVVQLLAAIYSIDTLGSLATPLGMARGETKLLFKRNLQKFAIRVPLIVAGIFTGGLMGLLYARMLAGAAGVLMDMVLIRRLIGSKVREQLRSNWRPFLSSLVMAAVVHALRTGRLLEEAGHPAWELLGIIGIAAVTYCSTSVLLWALSGRRAGPETEIAVIAGRLLRRKSALAGPRE